MDTDSHLKIAIREVTNVLDNPDHVKSESNDIMCFLGWVTIVFVRESKTNIAIPDCVQFEDILVEAMIIEVSEEFTQHVYYNYWISG